MIIEVQKLSKYYGENQILHDINFELEKGETLAILGKNGAGKSTLLEIIEGVNSHTDGRIIRRYSRLGAQLQRGGLPNELKVNEVIKFFASLQNTKVDDKNYQLFGIKDLLKKKVSNLSVGELRKVILTLCMLGEPDLIVLDEPTAGLDIEAKSELYKVLEELKSTGVSIILATHDMNEILKLGDRVIFLQQGKVTNEFDRKKLQEINESRYMYEINFNTLDQANEFALQISRTVLEDTGVVIIDCVVKIECINLIQKQKIDLVLIKYDYNNLDIFQLSFEERMLMEINKIGGKKYE